MILVLPNNTLLSSHAFRTSFKYVFRIFSTPNTHTYRSAKKKGGKGLHNHKYRLIHGSWRINFLSIPLSFYLFLSEIQLLIFLTSASCFSPQQTFLPRNFLKAVK